MKHWSETQSDTFKERAAYLGYTTVEEALEALGVAAMKDLPGSIGSALNRLQQIKQGNARQRIIDRGMNLVPVDDDNLGLIYGDMQQIRAIAHRARRFFPWAMPKGREDDLDDLQIMAAIQYAHLIGANPANEIHAWYDPKNHVFVIMPHYGFCVRKAKEADKRFMYWCEPMTDGLAEGDVGVVCYVRTGAQQDLLIELLRANLPYEIAHPQTVTQAVGVVRKHEMTGKGGRKIKPPTGWTWRQRAETRAITNAIRRAIGTTALAAPERQRLQRLGMGIPNGGEIQLDSEAVQALASGEIVESDAIPVDLIKRLQSERVELLAQLADAREHIAQLEREHEERGVSHDGMPPVTLEVGQ